MAKEEQGKDRCMTDHMRCAKLWSPSKIIIDIAFFAFHVSGYCTEVQIHRLIPESVEIISSPLYPTPYPNNVNCKWKLVNVVESFIRIHLVHVELDSNDRITVGRGSDILNGDVVMATYGYHNSFPNTITINFTDAWVLFVSDEEGRETGFSMEIQINDIYGTASVRV